MSVTFKDGTLIINTKKSPDYVRKFLRAHEPWRHKLLFSNGISTLDFKTVEPMQQYPLRKIQLVEQILGPLSGYKRVLDVGSNAGYNSIYLAEMYGTKTLGIDFWHRHIEVSKKLARLSDVRRCRFVQANAETFTDKKGFDLIIHFGTLYHLKNPVLALETALKNLRPGGLMLLGTQTYGQRDETRAAFINGLGGDKSNWWALGEASIVQICKIIGAKAEPIGDRFPLKIADQYRVLMQIRK